MELIDLDLGGLELKALEALVKHCQFSKFCVLFRINLARKRIMDFE